MNRSAGPFFSLQQHSCCPTALLRPPPSTFLEEANARPRPVSCGPFFLRQSAQQSQEERRPLESRGGFQQSLHINRLPTVGREECRPLSRSELERRANFAELFSRCALHHPQKSWRVKIEDPALKMRARGKVFRESGDFIRAEIDEQAFGEYKDLIGAAIEVREERSASLAVRKVHSNSFQRKTRFFLLENFF